MGSLVDGNPAPVFDGSSGYVRVGTQQSGGGYTGPPQLAVSSASLAVAAWVNPAGTPSSQAVVAGWEDSYLVGQLPDGTIGWSLNTASPGFSWVSTGIQLPVGQWSHVAVSYDGSIVRTYLNGVLQDAAAASGAISANTGYPFCIAARPDVAGSVLRRLDRRRRRVRPGAAGLRHQAAPRPGPGRR